MQTCWLASYPKSGNTWFRIFLANLLFPDRAPLDPNKLPISNLIASAREPFQEILGFKTSLLTSDESACLRPTVDAFIARSWSGSLCLRKAHDAYTTLPNGDPLMGQGPEFKALYILRDPWDVAVSAANHWNLSIDEAVDRMCNERPQTHRDHDINEQFPQHLLSWSGHVLSWLRSPLELCLIRYEDMHGDALATFSKATRFLGLEHDKQAIMGAIEASEFKRLQRLETEKGFVETPRSGTTFFRKGVKGEGLSRLTDPQIDRLRQQLALVDQEIENRADGDMGRTA